MRSRGGWTVPALLLACTLAGCPDEAAFVDASTGEPAFDDGQVLEVTRALAHGLLQSVVAVRGRLDDVDARLLADDLLEDARAARERAVVLGERLDLSLEATPLSEELERTSELRLERWIETTGSVTIEWLHDQVDAQRSAIDTIDAHLLPSARTPEVRELLRDLRALAADHLSRAEACAGD
jgi:hypothetical protein